VRLALQVRVTRYRDPLEGQTVRVLGQLRRPGAVKLLVVLPDGSERMIPPAWTDQEPAVGGDVAGVAAASGHVPGSLVRVVAGA
jgi:hypothetical protein